MLAKNRKPTPPPPPVACLQYSGPPARRNRPMDPVGGGLNRHFSAFIGKPWARCCKASKHEDTAQVHLPYDEDTMHGWVFSFSTSWTSAKVDVNGVRLHYQRTGEGDHAVLLLPGLLGSGETDFEPQLKKLNKKRFTLVAWEPRGYGHSRPPDRDFPVTFYERDAKDAVDLMKTLKFPKISLLGWSGGGITALVAAAKYPSYINQMVIWGASSYVTDEDERIYQGIRDISKWSERTRKSLEALYGYDYLAQTCEKWMDGVLQFKHLQDGNICRHLLPLIQCPTLIVHGEKDPIVPCFHAEFIHKHIKGSRLHLMPEGKHNVHLHFANEFNNLVEDFLQ
ncbi:PREDICTED: valacyclovir hydrolase [Elephantulus edwardii]|uniref:valacyclovir hydrolase n=1 Tax=Elephantulus edwardii TaxID=28737 RepID=UPI0003F071FA|nr:PREDICTED: valacyclovir hydrolase [Elephantulus edwardii]